MNWNTLIEQAIESLSNEEREGSIVYLEKRVIPKREALTWHGLPAAFDEDVVIAFVDLEPHLNWTHKGRYLVLAPKGNIQQIFNVDTPPYLRGVSANFRTVFIGCHAPEWASVAPHLELNGRPLIKKAVRE